MNAELKEFVRHALEMKADRGDIARVLTEAGWPAAEIAAALGAFAEIDFVTPPPRPKPFLSARETFFYLLMFGALYRVLWDIGSLAFDYIDKVVPDPAFSRTWNIADDIRWRIASLVVVFPLFGYIFWLIERQIVRDPLKAASRPRKWLTYLTLLLATLTLAGDLAYVVHDALGGELGMRVGLKMLVVAILALATFVYFLSEMRQGERE
jgi:hypothetical protein